MAAATLKCRNPFQACCSSIYLRQPTLPALVRYANDKTAAKKSSKLWMVRHKTDQFVRDRGTYRSRAAFKLKEIIERERLIKQNTRTIIDLGAAPGGWSQVLAETFKLASHRERCIVAVDLLSMESIKGVHFVQGNFLDPVIQKQVYDTMVQNAPQGHFGADVILSDMAPNVSGQKDRDISNAVEILQACWEFARTVLRVGHVFEEGNLSGVVREGGTLVMKTFEHPDITRFGDIYLKPSFTSIKKMKPEATQKNSTEFYFICKGYKGAPRVKNLLIEGKDQKFVDEEDL